MHSSSILSTLFSRSGWWFAALLIPALGVSPVGATAPVGYYRQPALQDETILFVAEGDLWKVPVTGGLATRLTSHPGYESAPAISPDGKLVAFTAAYEGPTEIYTMPLEGGLPTRRTYGTERAGIAGWTEDGLLLYSTEAYSTLPNVQLVLLDPRVEGPGEVIPLAQAADGSYGDDGETLLFTRLRFQGSHTKRYKGGTAQNIWKFRPGSEAVPLTADYPGTSKQPMTWAGQLFFVSDRDGTMNLWSMNPDGKELKQLTRHNGWEIQSPDLHDGRIVYQLGADLRLYDIATRRDRPLSITLNTDLDQMREHWIADPSAYLTSAHISPDGDRLVLTARGRVFVAPRKQGRFVEVTRQEGVRYREARFMPDGDSLVVLDSWILNRLLRKIWFYWSQHEGRGPIWNMQYAFGGHVVVLCDERTASDGEAFTEGIRRLGIGKIIGTRTWGGEIWLSSNDFLVDRGIATAAEYGVFSPEGEWLIEGHGVEPDIVVDNLPHETFRGRDAQLEAALEFLERKIAEEPVVVPDVPQHPDLSFR